MPSLRSLIEKAGLFDLQYYTSTYRESIGDGLEPLDHFIAVGQHKGFKPNAKFDPLLYLLQHPEAKQTGAVLHFLEHPENASANVSSAKLAFPQVQSPRHWPNSSLTVEDLKHRDAQAILENWSTHGQAEVLEFTVDGQAYRLVTPSADDLFSRFQSDVPFALPRLPHGFWDCLGTLRDARASIADSVPSGLFTDQQLDLLAERTCDELLQYKGVYAENFLSELLGGVARERARPDYLRSVSFKWQPTGDKRLFGRTDTLGPMERDQFRMVAQYFKPGEDIHESMVWKRWAYSGDLKRLPLVARERPVVLVGPARTGDLGARWQLPWFTHLEIPLNSYTQRYAILDRCKEAVLRAKEQASTHATKRPLIILQGGSFAYWLIARLHEWDPSVFYLDLGQALHIWFLDDRELWEHWLWANSRLVAEKCELDSLYRDRGIPLGVPFLSPRSRVASKHAPRPVYFQHLKKTGGTSLTEILRLFFPPESIAAAGEHLLGNVSIDVLLARLRDCSLVTDHSEILSAARPDAFKVAVFRNPMTRLLSERRQWMQAGKRHLTAATPAVAAATTALQDCSMVDILNSVFDYPVLVSSFWNHQTLTLGAWPLLRAEASLRRGSAYTWNSMHEHFASGSEFRSWLLANKARILDRALQSLKALDYVGLTEDFEASVHEIFARIGLPEPSEVVVRNARRAFDDENDPRINETAREFLELDNELYEAAVERHAVFGRSARGTPVDYIGRTLTTKAPVTVSPREAPGGHGWHPTHRRADGVWSRWSGPGRESRLAVSAPPGAYLMKIEIFGAASEKTLHDMQVEIEGQQLSTEVARLPDGLWTVAAEFERARSDRFDIVLRFPGLYAEHGIELKLISFLPIEAVHGA